ncbi:plant basic secretory protein [Rickenella mellea]|uniref:Plant basic secretory protein n=1 Tax=Rickenella mellea TaxID=50990 RepID=A0A4Y7QL70_9AGAM|nr:plant basic secretory protein [Rickenella mellea]
MPPPQVPLPAPDWPIPKLRIFINDLSSKGSTIFFDEVHPTNALRDAVTTVCKTLYTKQNVPRNVRSITLYLDDMDGVAYTKGSDLDNDHKEIHFSTRHIQNSQARAKDEILGVIYHEMVHCYQYDGKGSCPGGFIEDFVRLKAGLDPPHWRKGGDRWDAGYETTAYFFKWIEERYGEGIVQKLNETVKDNKYSDDIFSNVTGRDVGRLWKAYKESLSAGPG